MSDSSPDVSDQAPHGWAADGQTPRERIAGQQADERRKRQRRRWWGIGGIAAALAAVLGIVISSLVGGSSPASPGSQPLPAGVQPDLTVPRGTLASIGLGGVNSAQLMPVTGPALMADGKPEMLYIGAEWCPYCAAERWAMAVALTRFGTFSPLHGVHSAPSDVYPDTASLTFYGATYSSDYVNFTPVENQDAARKALQQPTSQQQALWSRYEPPGDGYPFIDFGNRYTATVTYNPQVLQGLSWNQIGTDLRDPSSPVAKSVNGSANLFTAAICRITGGKPGNVCHAPPITSLSHNI